MEFQHEYLRIARRKVLEKRGYFDDGEEDESPRERAPRGAPNGGPAAANGAAEAEIDPLDAFMAGIDAQVSQEKSQASATKRPVEKPSRFDDDHDSYLEDLARSHKKARPASAHSFEDSDEEVYSTAKQMDGDSDEDNDLKKTIEVLAPLDHSEIQYESFRKQFYKPHEAVAAMSDSEVNELRRELGVATDGTDVPRPIRSFVEVGFDRKMLGMLMKLGLEAPTPIQAQAFPIAMSGRDMIGIAKTGSGKTLAFTLPMVVHVMDQRELCKDEGPIAIVLSPTRELAHQIFGQAKKFLNVYGAQCAAIYGGVGKWDQIQALRKGAEVVVATPGRLIDMIRKKNVKTKRVTFVVLDEADRMFEMGFEPQLRSILGQVRPDRQTLMFSATFRKRVEGLARDVLENPIKITVGQIGQANEDIHQIAVVIANHAGKWPWLMANLQRITSEGRVLIFASSKTGCEELTKNLNAMKYLSSCLHGDKNQQERNDALAKFKSGEIPILVATDVASRGLDVKNVKTVVNYDVAKNIDTHVHRIGRTGRMGAEGFEPGTAYTLVTKNESQFAAQLVYNMDVSGQTVNSDLLSLAKRDSRFRRGVPASRGRGDGPRHGGDQTGSSLGVESNDLDAFDDEDEAEMKRWNASQKKSKADQRKGLGFGSSISGGGRNSSGGFRMSFVKASSASTLQESFRSSFVKSSTVSEPASLPTPEHRPPPPPPMQARVPPPVPAAAAAVTAVTDAPPPAALRPPPLPPAVIQAAIAQAQQRAASSQPGAPPAAPAFISPAVGSSDVTALNSQKNTLPASDSAVKPDHKRGRSNSRRSPSDHDRRSRSRSSSRGRRHYRRSHSSSRSRSRHRRSRSRDSRRRHRSRSRSRGRDRSSRRSRSRSRGRHYRR